MSPLLVLIVAVLATTYAGPIVRFAAAPALAIAFWRLAMVLPVTGGLAVLEGSREPGAGSRSWRVALLPAPRSLLLMALSGLLLAFHFWSWIASLRFTTVASSVVLVSLKPVFAWGLAVAWLREHPTRTERWGIALAVIGASLIGLGDARLSLGALGGDGLALLGAVTGAGYYVIGRRVRQTVGIWRYATGVYAVAAAVLALLALAHAAPLIGFARREWAVFGAMAAGPMLIGHTGMNYALRHFRATTVNVVALGEPVGASVIAWL
ncbi:MAG TPA: DMT family transporter, partial [Gemmatimonadales bacterium]|nr:DMT family transporter [Gemmatimonadales bacterium]